MTSSASTALGEEFPTLEAANVEASRALGELARDVLPGSVGRTLAIDVRNDFGPVLRVSMRFDVKHLA